MLDRFYSRGERFFKQNELSETCKISLGSVNPIIHKLEGIGALERKPLGFRLIDPRRALLYWAVTRDLEKDIVYTTFVPTSLEELEESLPRGVILTAFSGFKAKLNKTPGEYGQVLFGVILTAFSGFKAKLNKTPGEYGQVFVYSDSDEVQRAFKPTQRKRRNLFVLRSDEHLARLSKNGIVPLVQLYVDLWQLGALASRFVDELEKELSPAPTLALGEVARALKRPT